MAVCKKAFSPANEQAVWTDRLFNRVGRLLSFEKGRYRLLVEPSMQQIGGVFQ
ncbi:hypothetical protein D3C85_753960 [compost metagenome]